MSTGLLELRVTVGNKYATVENVSVYGMERARYEKKFQGIKFYRAYLPACIRDDINSVRFLRG